ncbi:SRPBCC domain-containing protein [Leptospira fletcheri]|uniref:SRPBCC domain-containing protein n=1 Tax=Leptospira fletcheri TaxID=2484981 RepID=A0A4R9GGL0_9LEPT|nr:SRPBCC domain-containing protein [Leptospira fletcheri]TGK11842.1 SRPBCC domain-containing protein [Leptospira fletcheri]
MSATPFVIERTYSVSADQVWKAITDKNRMKEWYFDLSEFKPEIGFEFSFEAGPEDKKYVHLCRITEAIPGKKLAYSWKYQGYPGDSKVIFELFSEGSSDTKLRLTHEGIETFPNDNPVFARENFQAGWTELIGTQLKNFLEKKGA